MADLKPCPFCGGEARIREDAKLGGIVGCMPADERMPERKCHDHFMVYIGFGKRANVALKRLSKAEAIRMWNKRTPIVTRGAPNEETP